MGSGENKKCYLSGPLSVAEWLLLKPSLSLGGVNIVGQDPSCLQGTFFDNGADLSGKSEAILNCSFGHIRCHEWGYGKFVMWPPKEKLDNIQFGNKRPLVQTDQPQRPNSTLSLIVHIDTILGHAGWMSISQLNLLLTTL